MEYELLYVERPKPEGLRLTYRISDGVLTARLEQGDGSVLEEDFNLRDIKPGERVRFQSQVLPINPILEAWAVEGPEYLDGKRVYVRLILWSEPRKGESPQKAFLRAIEESWFSPRPAWG